MLRGALDALKFLVTNFFFFCTFNNIPSKNVYQSKRRLAAIMAACAQFKSVQCDKTLKKFSLLCDMYNLHEIIVIRATCACFLGALGSVPYSEQCYEPAITSMPFVACSHCALENWGDIL